MIRLENVSYCVKENNQEKLILDNVSCAFNDGEFVAITGQNGGGKSTITKLIMGIIAPTSGKIFFNEIDITNYTVSERAKLGINYAFQQPVTFQGLTVKDLIDIATGTKNTLSKACECLSVVGLCAKEYVNRNFDKTLSGGEQKRIELAVALAKEGNCYIFDEPEAGIDLWSFEKLNELFNKDKTYIVVSHQEKLLKNADKIMIINNGKISAYDKSKKVLPTIKNLA